MKMALNGGAATQLAVGYPVDITLDAMRVYWTADDLSGRVMKLPLGSSTATQRASSLPPAGRAAEIRKRSNFRGLFSRA
jgi:hypothetical protein